MSKQIHSQEEKKDIVKEAEKTGNCQHDIHFTTIYGWQKKIDEAGEEGLPKKSGGHNKRKRCIEEWC